MCGASRDRLVCRCVGGKQVTLMCRCGRDEYGHTDVLVCGCAQSHNKASISGVSRAIHRKSFFVLPSRGGSADSASYYQSKASA